MKNNKPPVTGSRTGSAPSKTRGVEHPNGPDMAANGPTQNELHSRPLRKVIHKIGSGSYLDKSDNA